MSFHVHFVTIFASAPGGGNPAPIVVNADGMSDEEMQGVASEYGYEGAFVLSPPAGPNCDFALRFWVPKREMNMCGHAVVGTVWLLDRLGMLPRSQVTLCTQSGLVNARVFDPGTPEARVEISQPQGRVETLPDSEKAEILSVLGVTESDLAPLPIQNASTSRMKTLVPLKSVALLDGLRPDFGRMEQLCERLDSTGLYPYAINDGAAQVFDARQFPKSSGFPEDSATGIAATALAFGLLANGLVQADGQKPITVRQGRAMGRPSEIRVQFRMDDAGQVQGCWLGGNVGMEER